MITIHKKLQDKVQKDLTIRQDSKGYYYMEREPHMFRKSTYTRVDVFFDGKEPESYSISASGRKYYKLTNVEYYYKADVIHIMDFTDAKDIPKADPTKLTAEQEAARKKAFSEWLNSKENPDYDRIIKSEQDVIDLDKTLWYVFGKRPDGSVYKYFGPLTYSKAVSVVERKAKDGQTNLFVKKGMN